MRKIALAIALCCQLNIQTVFAVDATAPLVVLDPKGVPQAPLSRIVAGDELVRGGGGGFFTYFDCVYENNNYGGRILSQKVGDGTYNAKCIDPYSDKPKLSITRNGARHALYEKAVDGSFSAEGKYLALRNGTKRSDGKYIERLRIIEVASKKSVSLPLIPCTQNIQRWSQGKLITTSGDLMYEWKESGDMVQVFPTSKTEICVWNTTGKLLGRVEAHRLNYENDGGTTSLIGLLPSEKLSMYTLTSSDDSDSRRMGGDPDCQISAIDLQNPSRANKKIFNATQGSASCSPHEIELDLKSFTIESPSFRFRIHRQVPGAEYYVTKPEAWKQVR